MWVRMRDLAVITEGIKSLERKRTKAKSETDAIKCLRQIYLQPSRATHKQTTDKKDEPRSLKDEHLALSFILCPNKPIQLVILHKQSSGHQLEDIDSSSAGQIWKDPGKLRHLTDFYIESLLKPNGRNITKSLFIGNLNSLI